MMRRLSVLTMTIASISTVCAQPLPSPFNTQACAERVGLNWCAPAAKDQGWILKYKSKNPDNLSDLYWLIEVWTRDRDVMLCEFRGNQGGTLFDFCQALREVVQ
jgi:hypothetical protein